MSNPRRFDNLRDRWEQRARKHQSDLVGVLCRGLSPALNGYIHNQHLRLLQDELLARLHFGSRVLDLGCGYGRIGMAIRDKRPDIELIGCDHALAYCQLNRKNVQSPTICCDLNALPFHTETFHGIVAVTSLMYLAKNQRVTAVKQVLALLRPGGLALFIEPAQGIQQMMAMLRPESARNTTGGSGFTANELEKLIEAAGGFILARGGTLLFTLSLPFLVLMDRMPRLQSLMLKAITSIDRWLLPFHRFSLHRWILLQLPPAKSPSNESRVSS